ncbi:unnamed protein product [Moneuplotes crassus]|uniref:Uncharacterized protein n=1 Tax=Euplotes crassus TaxID=5936 RepID=A0AAD1XBI7_EUPCR|nr:unnamed protein product [Moneuplotes crassus]
MKSIKSLNKFPIDFFYKPDSPPGQRGYSHGLSVDGVLCKIKRRRKGDTFSKYSYIDQYRGKNLDRDYKNLRSSKSSRGNYNSSPEKKKLLCKSQEEVPVNTNKSYVRYTHSSRAYKPPGFGNDKKPPPLFLSVSKNNYPVLGFAPRGYRNASMSDEGSQGNLSNRSTNHIIQNKLIKSVNPYCREKNDTFNNESSITTFEQSLEPYNANFYTSKSCNAMKIHLKSPSIDSRRCDTSNNQNLYQKIHVQGRNRPLNKRQGPKTLEIPGFSKKKRKKNAVYQADSLNFKKNIWNSKNYLQHCKVTKTILGTDSLKCNPSEMEEMLNSTAEFYKPSSKESSRRESKTNFNNFKKNQVKVVSRVKSENKDFWISKPRISTKGAFNPYGKKYGIISTLKKQKIRLFNPQIGSQDKVCPPQRGKIWERLRLKTNESSTRA